MDDTWVVNLSCDWWPRSPLMIIDISVCNIRPYGKIFLNFHVKPEDQFKRNMIWIDNLLEVCPVSSTCIQDNHDNHRNIFKWAYIKSGDQFWPHGNTSRTSTKWRRTILLPSVSVSVSASTLLYRILVDVVMTLCSDAALGDWQYLTESRSIKPTFHAPLNKVKFYVHVQISITMQPRIMLLGLGIYLWESVSIPPKLNRFELVFKLY